MKTIDINPELLGVREKLFMGFELWQLFDLALGFLFSLCMVVLLPDMGMVKGIISVLTDGSRRGISMIWRIRSRKGSIDDITDRFVQDLVFIVIENYMRK